MSTTTSTLIYYLIAVTANKPKSRGGAVVARPILVNYTRLHVARLQFTRYRKDREVVGSNPAHGACISFWRVN